MIASRGFLPTMLISRRICSWYDKQAHQRSGAKCLGRTGVYSTDRPIDVL
jgi:hypothetical protein